MKRTHVILVAAVIILLIAAGLAFEVVTTQPVRGAMRTCSAIFTIANRPDLTDSARLDAARSLCSTRYLQAHPLALAAEGGLSGFPRNINKKDRKSVV